VWELVVPLEVHGAESASRPLINFGDNVNHNLGGLTF
jgi:hypothetical protein